MFATLNSYSNNAPKVFQARPGTQLITVPVYGISGYPNQGTNLPSSYSSLGEAYNAIPSQQTSNNFTPNGNMTIMNAYSLVQKYAPMKIMGSPVYSDANCIRRNQIYN